MDTTIHPEDQRDPLGKAFAGSLATHAGMVAAVLALGTFNLADRWGSQHPSSGSVGVTMVSTIPIPRHEGPINPVANDTRSIVPQEAKPIKAKPVSEAPDPRAIAIPDKAEKKFKPKPLPPVAVYQPQQYQPNQVYSRTAQSMNSPLYGIQGAGGIDVGPASVLGTRFEAYTNLMRQQISQHWNRADVHASPSQRCAVTFTIARNGQVGNVQISHPSGSYLLDNSARRAIVDSNPLPSLPTAFTGNEATVEIWFQLTQ